MKLNIADPSTGSQKTFNIEDERRLRILMDKRISAEVPGDSIGEEFKGYIFKISGGNDKQGFPMKQGVLVPHRVRLLLAKGHSCYRPRRSGERKRKSVRGCIVSSDLSVVSLVVVQKGAADIPGVTDTLVPKRLGPKRATKIRKLYNLTKKVDVRKFVVRRVVVSKKEGIKDRSKAPKIQRLVTPARLQRKRKLIREKRARNVASRSAALKYKSVVVKYQRQLLDKKHARKVSRQASVGHSKH